MAIRLGRVRRLPLAYWAGVGVLALISVALTRNQLDAARQVRQTMGTTREVWITATAIAAGAPVVPGALKAQRVPLAFLPDEPVLAARRITPGARAATALPADTILSTGLLTEDSLSALSLAVRPDHVAMGIPVSNETVPTEPGDLVDLLAPGLATIGNSDPAASDRSAQVPTVARRARVLRVETERLVVEVDERSTSAVALAVDSGAVTVVLLGAN